jgi:predicted GNAT family N-acyltransferase
MRHNFFVILGQEGRKENRKVFKPANRHKREPDLEILKESPCLRCELFVEETSCPYVRGCSKIDEFQRLAAVHCTLCKPQDIRSIVKI